MQPYIRNLQSVNEIPKWLKPVALGLQIRQIREALGMTQLQLAERSNLRQSVIAEIEKGKRKDLCLTTVAKLAKGLNCQPVVQMVPQKKIDDLIDEKSTELARKLVAASSGSAAIELQMPHRSVVSNEIREAKRDILEKHKSSLWQKI
ncbi:MAG: helix-turn-helix domain-containing protein [Candidatus Omnitrophica bacterium]|nr:helix-turn-helix domain-containing protein [Candidatus Omnitrophota bacterium]